MADRVYDLNNVDDASDLFADEIFMQSYKDYMSLPQNKLPDFAEPTQQDWLSIRKVMNNLPAYNLIFNMMNADRMWQAVVKFFEYDKDVTSNRKLIFEYKFDENGKVDDKNSSQINYEFKEARAVAQVASAIASILTLFHNVAYNKQDKLGNLQTARYALLMIHHTIGAARLIHPLMTFGKPTPLPENATEIQKQEYEIVQNSKSKVTDISLNAITIATLLLVAISCAIGIFRLEEQFKKEKDPKAREINRLQKASLIVLLTGVLTNIISNVVSIGATLAKTNILARQLAFLQKGQDITRAAKAGAGGIKATASLFGLLTTIIYLATMALNIAITAKQIQKNWAQMDTGLRVATVAELTIQIVGGIILVVATLLQSFGVILSTTGVGFVVFASLMLLISPVQFAIAAKYFKAAGQYAEISNLYSSKYGFTGYKYIEQAYTAQGITTLAPGLLVPVAVLTGPTLIFLLGTAVIYLGLVLLFFGQLIYQSILELKAVKIRDDLKKQYGSVEKYWISSYGVEASKLLGSESFINATLGSAREMSAEYDRLITLFTLSPNEQQLYMAALIAKAEKGIGIFTRYAYAHVIDMRGGDFKDALSDAIIGALNGQINLASELKNQYVTSYGPLITPGLMLLREKDTVNGKNYHKSIINYNNINYSNTDWNVYDGDTSTVFDALSFAINDSVTNHKATLNMGGGDDLVLAGAINTIINGGTGYNGVDYSSLFNQKKTFSALGGSYLKTGEDVIIFNSGSIHDLNLDAKTDVGSRIQIAINTVGNGYGKEVRRFIDATVTGYNENTKDGIIVATFWAEFWDDIDLRSKAVKIELNNGGGVKAKLLKAVYLTDRWIGIGHNWDSVGDGNKLTLVTDNTSIGIGVTRMTVAYDIASGIKVNQNTDGSYTVNKKGIGTLPVVTTGSYSTTYGKRSEEIQYLSGVYQNRAIYAGVDTLTNIQWIRGTAYDDTFNGGDGANIFIASAGNDEYVGDGGIDTLDYSAISNIKGLNKAGVTIVASSSGGNSPDGTVQYNLYSEKITNKFTSIENFRGTVNADTITGNDYANMIDGFGGNDSITGLGGNDQFKVGGLGNATVDGGSGTDLIDFKSSKYSYSAELKDDFKGTVTEANQAKRFRGQYILFRKDSTDNTKDALIATAIRVMRDGVDIALYCAVTSSGNVSDAASLVDGNVENAAAREYAARNFIPVANAWMMIDLGAIHDFDTIDVMGCNTNSAIFISDYSLANLAENYDSLKASPSIYYAKVPAVTGSKSNKQLTINDFTGSFNSSSYFTSLIDIENMSFGSGNDTIIGNKADNLLDGGDGNDNIKAFAGKDDILTGAGNDTVDMGMGDDQVHVVHGSNVLRLNTDFLGASEITLSTTGSVAGIDLNSINNIFKMGGASISDGKERDATVVRINTSISGVLSFWLTCYDGYNKAIKVELTDRSEGGINAKVVEAKYTNDVINNTDYDWDACPTNSNIQTDSTNSDKKMGYALRSMSVKFTSNWYDSKFITGGDGVDLINYNDIYNSFGIKANLTDGKVYQKGNNVQASYYDYLNGIENIVATKFADEITGNLAANKIDAGNGDDSISADGGDDLIFTGEGKDTVNAGDGNDVIVVEHQRTKVFLKSTSSLASKGKIDLLNPTNIWTKLTVADIDFSDPNTKIIIQKVGSTEVVEAKIVNVDTSVAGRVSFWAQYWTGSSTDPSSGSTVAVKVQLTDMTSGNIETEFLSAASVSERQNTSNFDWNNFNVSDVSTKFTIKSMTFSALIGKFTDGKNIYGDAGVNSVHYTNGYSKNGGIRADLRDMNEQTVYSSPYLGLYSNDLLKDSLKNIQNIYTTVGKDTIYGGNSSNVINANEGDDIVEAGGGNDTIYTGTGNDTVNGEAGNDLFVVDHARSSKLISYTNDYLTTSGTNLSSGARIADINLTAPGTYITLNGGSLSGNFAAKVSGIDKSNPGRVVFWAETWSDGYTKAVKIQLDEVNSGSQVTAKVIAAACTNGDVRDTNYDWSKGTAQTIATSDTATGYGVKAIVLVATYGILDTKTIYGGSGENTVDYTSSNLGIEADLTLNKIKISGDWGVNVTDSISNIKNIKATDKNDSIIGDDLRNSIYAYSGNDNINSKGGDDFISTGLGTDVVNAGEGDDHIEVMHSTTSTGFKNIDGGVGYDLVNYSKLTGFNNLGLNANLSNTQNQTVGIFSGTDPSNKIKSVEDKLLNIENLMATGGDDTVIGSDFANKIVALEGNDSVTSGAGDDTIYTGAGADNIDAGSGSDWVGVEHSQAVWRTSGYLSAKTKVSLCSVGVVADLDFADPATSIILNGALLGSDQTAQIVGVDFSVDGLVSFWAQYWDGTSTIAIKVLLKNETAGVSASVLKASSVARNVSGVRYDWDADTGNYQIATADSESGIGIKAMTLSRLGAWTDNKKIDGGAGSDYVDYSRIKVGSYSAVTNKALTINAIGLVADLSNISTQTVMARQVASGKQVDSSQKDSLSNIENFGASEGDDSVIGSAFDNQIYAYAGSDYVNAADGDDTIHTGFGIDTILAGEGDDAIVVSHSAATWEMNTYLTKNISKISKTGIISDLDLRDGVSSIILNGTLIGSDVSAKIVNLDYSKSGQVTFWAQYYRGTDTIAVKLELTNDSTGGISAKVLGATSVSQDMTDTVFNWDDALLRKELDIATTDLSSGIGVKYTTLSRTGAWTDIKTIDGGNGVDYIDYSRTISTIYFNNGIDADLSKISDQRVKTIKVIDGVQVSDSVTDLLSNIENIIATDGDDRIIGSELDNKIQANAGNDDINGGAGNDGISTGTGKDKVNGGAGNDAIRVEHMQAVWRVPTYYLNTSGSVLFNTVGKVRDVDFTDSLTTITLCGNSTNGDQKANITGIDYSALGVVSFWAVYYDGTLSKAVKIQLSDEANGDISAKVLRATSTIGNVIGSVFNWDQVPSANDIAYATPDSTMPGIGVKAMTLSRLGLWADAKQIDGGDDVDTLDYSRVQIGTYYSSAINAIGIDANLSVGKVRARKANDGSIIENSIFDDVKNIENIIATAGNDKIIGSDSANNIALGAGDDSVEGLGGNDTIDVSIGKDTVLGGAGDDVIVVEHSQATWAIGTYLSNSTPVKFKITGKVEDTDINDAATQITLAGALTGGNKMAKITRVDYSILGQVSFWAQYYDGTSTLAVKVQLTNETTGDISAKVLRATSTIGNVIDSVFNWDMVPTVNDLVVATSDTSAGIGVKAMTLSRLGVWTDVKQVDAGDGIDTVDYSRIKNTQINEVGIYANLSDISKQTVQAKQAMVGSQVVGTVVDQLANVENMVATGGNDSIIGSLLGNKINANSGDDYVDGAGGDDQVLTGIGLDTVIGGEGDDLIRVEHEQATWQTNGYLTNIDASVCNIGRVKGIDFKDLTTNIVLNGSLLGADQVAVVTGVDSSISGQLSLWAQYYDGSYTRAVKVLFKDTSTGGVSASVVGAATAIGDVRESAFNWDNALSNNSVNIATSDTSIGIGVKTMTLARLGAWADIKTIDGGIGVDTLDYGMTSVGSSTYKTITNNNIGPTTTVDTPITVFRYLTTADTDFMTTGTVADINLSATTNKIILNGGSIVYDFVAKISLVNSTVANQLSFWAEFWDGVQYTKAVQIQLTNKAGGGVTARAIQAKYFGGNNKNLQIDWNNQGYKLSGIATSDSAAGYGVKSLTLSQSTPVSTNAYLTRADTPFMTTGTVADIDLSATANKIILNGGSIGSNFVAKISLVDRTVAKQLSFWAEFWDGVKYTKAVQIQLTNKTGGGVTARAIQSKYFDGNNNNLQINWNNQGSIMGIADSDGTPGYGVRSMTLNTANGTLTSTDTIRIDTITTTLPNTVTVEDKALGINVDLSNVNAQTIKTRQASDGAIVADSVTDTATNIENIIGTAGDDRIVGSDAANQLAGLDGSDSISGGGGNDTLRTGIGQDTVDGGSGDDMVIVEHNRSVQLHGRYVLLRHLPGTPFALSLSELEVWSGGVNVARSSGVQVIESGDGSLSTAAAKNLIDGTDSYYQSNKTDGSSWVMVDLGKSYAISSVLVKTRTAAQTAQMGADIRLFIAQNDVRTVDNIDFNRLTSSVNVQYVDLLGQNINGARALSQDGAVSILANQFSGGQYVDVKTINGGDGTDVVVYKSSDGTSTGILGVGIDGSLITNKVNTWYENGAVKQGSAVDVLSNVEGLGGTDFDDRLIGNDLANRLDGFNGNDSIEGGAGNDTIYSGTGRDTLQGGAGDDGFIVNHEAPSIIGRYILIKHKPGIARQLGLSEIKVWAKDVNIALKATVQESVDGHVSTYDAKGLVDGVDDKSTVTGTYRSAGSDGNSWVMLDLGASYLIDKIDISSLNSSTTSLFGADIGLFVSTNSLIDDAHDYVKLASRLDTRYTELDSTSFNNTTSNYLSLSIGSERFIFNKKIDGGDGTDFVNYRSSEGAKGVGVQANLSEGKVYTWFEKNSVKVGSSVDILTNIENIGATDVADNMIGNEKDNMLVGFDGNDTINGGAGNDQLGGGQGDDVYKFIKNWGRDVIYEENSQTIDKSWVVNNDVIEFDSGIEYTKLFFTKQNNALLISEIGSSNTVVIDNWYGGAAADDEKSKNTKIEKINLGSRSIIGSANIEGLVSQLASFGVPSSISSLSTAKQSEMYLTMGKYWT